MASASVLFYQHGQQAKLKMIIPDNRKQGFLGKLREFKEIIVQKVIKCQQQSDLQEYDLGSDHSSATFWMLDSWGWFTHNSDTYIY